MLELLVTTERGRRRYFETPIGACIEGYLEYLRTRGFAPAHMLNHARLLAAFGEYLAENDVPLSAITEEHVDGFARWYLRNPRRYGMRRQPGRSYALTDACLGCGRRLLAYLRSIVMTPPRPSAPLPHPHLLAYLEFLEHHRGFAQHTLALHRRHVGHFLDAVGPLAMETLAVADVEQAVIRLSKHLGVRSQQIMISAIRSFLQFARTTNRIPMGCRPFLPYRRQYALAHLPAVLTEAEVKHVLAAIADRTSAMGRRDYAILQLLATYGLRASEIAGLRLDDVDWRGEVLHIRQQKVRRRLLLPLMEPVVSALVAYLRDGRPVTDDRQIFRTCHAPAGPITRATVYDVVCKAIKVAGIMPSHRGPHMFRHARATSLLRGGASLKTIGDLLGHRVPVATAIYCKLAVDDLRTVALEIPSAEVSR